MSASWDPDREGSFIGFDEFKRNIRNVQDGFDRTKQNSLLRDKVKRLSDEEIQLAIKDLDDRERKLLEEKNRSI